MLGSRPRKMFSATDISSTGESSWWIMATPSSWALAGESMVTSFPSIKTCPPSLRWMPAMIFIMVDFPAPFSPIRAWTVPGSSLKSTPWRTSTP